MKSKICSNILCSIDGSVYPRGINVVKSKTDKRMPYNFQSINYGLNEFQI